MPSSITQSLQVAHSSMLPVTKHALKDASPKEAAQYGLRAANGVARSPLVNQLLGCTDEDTRRARLDVLQSAKLISTHGDTPLPLNRCTSEHVEDLVRHAQQSSVGNCMELCLVAASAIVRAGYPWPVSLIAVTGTVPDALLDHCLIRVGAPAGEEYVIVDPLAEKIPYFLQVEETGREGPSIYEEPTYASNMLIIAHTQQGVRLLRHADCPNAEMHHVGTLQYAHEGPFAGRLQFEPQQA